MFLRKRIYPVSVAVAIMFAAAMFALALMPATAKAQGGFEIKHNYGLERGDYKDFDLSQPVWEHCRDACAAESACVAFTYTIPIAGVNGRPAHCWLKNVINRGGGNDWCITGIKQGGSGSSCGSDYSIQAPGSVDAYSKVNIRYSFRGAKPTGQTDWIGIIGPGKHYNAWVWVKDIAGCDLILTAPAAGNYEIQYILSGDNWPVAARTNLRVQ